MQPALCVHRQVSRVAQGGDGLRSTLIVHALTMDHSSRVTQFMEAKAAVMLATACLLTIDQSSDWGPRLPLCPPNRMTRRSMVAMACPQRAGGLGPSTFSSAQAHLCPQSAFNFCRALSSTASSGKAGPEPTFPQASQGFFCVCWLQSLRKHGWNTLAVKDKKTWTG